ncbi:hypothetical protein J6590_018198 [Homalodisca vitripennis]|nr:hypothetical protein J6590_018198 [Homalodisca vitripennis]
MGSRQTDLDERMCCVYETASASAGIDSSPTETIEANVSRLSLSSHLISTALLTYGEQLLLESNHNTALLLESNHNTALLLESNHNTTLLLESNHNTALLLESNHCDLHGTRMEENSKTSVDELELSQMEGVTCSCLERMCGGRLDRGRHDAIFINSHLPFPLDNCPACVTSLGPSFIVWTVQMSVRNRLPHGSVKDAEIHPSSQRTLVPVSKFLEYPYFPQHNHTVHHVSHKALVAGMREVAGSKDLAVTC